MSTGSEVPIREFYQGYKPPLNLVAVVKRLLSRIPEKYVRGLDCVVVTNLSGQSRRNRLGKTASRGRRVSQSRVLGRYHPRWRGQPPWIELYADQILSRFPRWTLWVPFVRDAVVADTLYHELGHHVHCSSGLSFAKRRMLRTTGRRNSVGISFDASIGT